MVAAFSRRAVHMAASTLKAPLQGGLVTCCRPNRQSPAAGQPRSRWQARQLCPACVMLSVRCGAVCLPATHSIDMSTTLGPVFTLVCSAAPNPAALWGLPESQDCFDAGVRA